MFSQVCACPARSFSTVNMSSTRWKAGSDSSNRSCKYRIPATLFIAFAISATFPTCPWISRLRS